MGENWLAVLRYQTDTLRAESRIFVIIPIHKNIVSFIDVEYIYGFV